MNKYFSTKHEIVLEKKLGSGGEGTVYDVNNMPNICAKIYHKPSLEQYNKIKVMVKQPPVDPSLKLQNHRSIIWPIDIVYKDSEKKQFVGFLMPKINMNNFYPLHYCFSQKDRINNLGINFNWKHLYCIALNTVSSIAALHRVGYCIGDINQRNILISSDSLIIFVDCDSYQIKDQSTGTYFFCPVGIGEYTPPELMGKSFKTEKRTIESDSFSVAVLIFQILMMGFHPFSGRYRSGKDISLDEKIKTGLFGFSSNSNEISPPKDAPPFDILPSKIKELFLKCFIAGHDNPNKRPSAEKWWIELKNNLGQIMECDIYRHHLYSRHLNECPWCNCAKIDNDFFPSVGSQIKYQTKNLGINIDKEILGLIEGAFIDNVITDEEEKAILKKTRSLGYNKKKIEGVKSLINQKRKLNKVQKQSKFQIKPKTYTPTRILQVGKPVLYSILISFFISAIIFIKYLKIWEPSVLQIFGIIISLLFLLIWLVNILSANKNKFIFYSLFFISLTHIKLLVIFLPILLTYLILRNLIASSDKKLLIVLIPLLCSTIVYNTYSLVFKKQFPWPLYSFFYERSYFSIQNEKKTKIIKAERINLLGEWLNNNIIIIITHQKKNGNIKGYIKKHKLFFNATLQGIYYSESNTISLDVKKNSQNYGKFYGKFKGNNNILQIMWLSTSGKKIASWNMRKK